MAEFWQVLGGESKHNSTKLRITPDALTAFVILSPKKLIFKKITVICTYTLLFFSILCVKNDNLSQLKYFEAGLSVLLFT